MFVHNKTKSRRLATNIHFPTTASMASWIRAWDIGGSNPDRGTMVL